MKFGALAICLLLATSARAGDVSIYGDWRVDAGDIAHIYPCDRGVSKGNDMPDVCVTLTTGPYKGSFLGSGTKQPLQAGQGTRFKGQLTDPTDGRTYRGYGEIRGGTLLVSGCFLIICEKQVWRKLYSVDGRAD